jgi:hypothetical protein
VTKHSRVSSNNFFVYLGPLSYKMSMLPSPTPNAFIELADIHTSLFHQLRKTLHELAVSEGRVRTLDQALQGEIV